jgi:hypothetical protein
MLTLEAKKTISPARNTQAQTRLKSRTNCFWQATFFQALLPRLPVGFVALPSSSAPGRDCVLILRKGTLPFTNNQNEDATRRILANRNRFLHSRRNYDLSQNMDHFRQV